MLRQQRQLLLPQPCRSSCRNSDREAGRSR
jgi:hypothetical protein